MTRVIIAARLSRKGQGQRDGLGIETQDSYAREWAEREGHTVIATVADTVSGTKAPIDRKNLSKWITSPQLLGRYDAIVAYTVDRLSRGDQTDFVDLEHWAMQHGKKFLIVDGLDGEIQFPARHTTDVDRWDAEKKAASRELKKIRERCGRSQRAIRASGHLVGRAPFGYVIAGDEYAKHLVADPVKAKLVRGMFERITAGQSLEEVARWITASGFPVYARSVSTMVRNPVYRGARRDGYAAPAIVTATEFQNAGFALDGSGKPRPAGSAAPKAMLAGVLRCGNCGAPMYRIVTGDAPRYRCHGEYGADRTRKGKGCGNVLDLAAVDGAVSGWMAASTKHVTDVRPREATATREDLSTAELAAQKALAGHDFAQLAELTAQIKVLTAQLESEEADSSGSAFEVVELDETYGQRWNGLDEAQRAAWLRSSGVKVYARAAGENGVWKVQPSELTWLAGDDDVTVLICGAAA
jgi:DNA invertase Pin-like site-specific DNA recombinase